MTINQAGYCTQCGTFRGLPVAPHPGYPGQPQPTSGGPGYPAQPAAAHPGSGVPYPGSGAPYPGSGAAYPGNAVPYPASGAPVGYPAAGGGYGGYPVSAPPPNRGRSYLVPLVALGSTFAVLVAAIAVVLVIRSAGGSTAAPTDIDPCVVGTWQVDSHREEVALDEPFGKTTFTGTGPGAVVELGADGHGVTDYGDGTTFEGTVSGITVTLTFEGRITFRYKAVDGTVSFEGVRADGTVWLSAPDVESQNEPLEASSDPASYECDGDRLTQRTAFYTVVMSRR
ncbi:hypothetical protein ACN27F_19200 [Solwaraspora sp. WMMB335]|uniref:hypothetical protein n=1 Tax=Solwaraspora sp. WMMB335 TaxID=3404118 RepID=UPI003B95BE36